MEGERHLSSNLVDIEATINNAIEHFLYEESFREEQKICLNLGVRCSLRKHPVFLAQVCSFTLVNPLRSSRKCI